MLCTLNALPRGESGVVTALHTDGAMRRRLMDIGLTPGTRVVSLYRGCFGDPTAYLIRDTVIALRGEDAGKVIVRI